MGREGPVLYCKGNAGALVKVLIPEEKLFHCSPAFEVMLCCTTSMYLPGRKALNCDVNLGLISLDFQLFPEK